MKCIYLYILLLLLCSDLEAQYRFDNYKHLTAKDGLPSTYSFEVAEDKYGFIWIATASGLARYDGSKVSRLEKIETDSVYLPSQYIQSLLITGDSLWIGTRKGLSILNITNRKITNHLLKSENFELRDDVHERTLLRDIYEDRQGNVWLAPAYGGFVKWDRATQKFNKFPMYPDEALPSSYAIGEQTGLNVIIQDSNYDSIMWGINNSGLIKLNRETGEISRILFEEGSELYRFDVNRKICLYQAANGLIYTGSWKGGLSIYDPSSGSYFLPSKDFKNQFPSELVGATLLTITPGEEGYLYLGYSNGLYRYNINTHSHQIIKSNVFKGKAINCLLYTSPSPRDRG